MIIKFLNNVKYNFKLKKNFILYKYNKVKYNLNIYL